MASWWLIRHNIYWAFIRNQNTAIISTHSIVSIHRGLYVLFCLMDAEDRALGSHVYMVWMWVLWPHLCSALDVLRLAGELSSHSEKYISKLSELEPKSKTIIFCCVCVTLLLAELVVTRGGKLTDRARRRQRLHKAQTRKYFVLWALQIHPVFDPEENPRTIQCNGTLPLC